MGRESNRAHKGSRGSGGQRGAAGRGGRAGGVSVGAGPEADAGWSGEVEVLRWAHGGDAVVVPSEGPLGGRIVFLEDAVPGDRLRIAISENKVRWGRGRILKMLTPSPERRAAPCPIQARCGGCPWMIGSAAAQEASRRAILEGEVKKRLGDGVPVRLESSPGELGYRQRLVLAFDRVGAEARLGFHSRRSHTLVELPASGCAVARPALSRALPAVRAALIERVAEGRRGKVTLLAGADDEVGGWVEPEGGGAFGFGAAEVEVRLGGYTQRLAPRAFAQANGEVTGQILARLAAWARRQRGAADGLAVELFAGSGTLTMALWEAGWRVLAYEGDGHARAAFEATRERLGVPAERGAWHVADLGGGLPWPPPGETPGVVVLDPPRTGALALMPWVRGSGAPAVAYLSCDLATGLRDVRELVGSPGTPGPYVVEEVVGYDMFPHSGHQEVLLLLALRA